MTKHDEKSQRNSVSNQEMTDHQEKDTPSRLNSDWCPTCGQGWDCAKRDQAQRVAMRRAANELGVPQPGYPAPVENAANILRAALGDIPPAPSAENNAFDANGPGAMGKTLARVWQAIEDNRAVGGDRLWEHVAAVVKVADAARRWMLAWDKDDPSQPHVAKQLREACAGLERRNG